MKPDKPKYGWKPDVPDINDRKFTVARGMQIPPRMDLREWCGAILNQGNLGSCTAHALASGHIFAQRKAGKDHLFLPSRLFIYWNERKLEGNIKSDSGAMIKTGIKVLAGIGACEEVLWGYEQNFRDKPTDGAFENARKHLVSQYERISDLQNLKCSLALEHPVVIGFSVYQSFESEEVARTGIVPMPRYGETMLGGHAVLVVGYDDTTKSLIVMNSWGSDWGDNGYFHLPYGFIEDTDLSDDFWSIIHVA